MKNQQLAELHSLSAFLNSLLLEWDGFQIIDNNLVLPLDENTIYIPLKYQSLLGRHEYQGISFLENPSGLKTELSVTTLITIICDYLAKKQDLKSFQKNVLNSLHNIKTSLDARESDIKELYDGNVNFKTTEQGLLLGHAFHPTPKSRSEFSDNDFKLYSPEMGAQFPLFWIHVSSELLFEKHSEHFQDPKWLHNLFVAEFGTECLKKGHTPFPLHPWQRQFIYQHPVIKKYLSEKKILEQGASDRKWIPTSSLRTLYHQKADYQLKFSLSLKMTNSVRHLLVKELDRGLQVHDVFSTNEGKKFSQENPQFKILHEPVYAGIKDLEGNPLQITLLMGRENPFTQNSKTIVLATLNQNHPLLGKNIIHQYIEDYSAKHSLTPGVSARIWLKKFLDNALKPLLSAQSEYGILLGSHQQNMILEIEDNLPLRSYFRDCNGTGYSKLGFKKFSGEVASLVKENGNILEGEEAHYLLGYYIIINSTFNVITSIAQSGYVSEIDLIQQFCDYLTDLKLKEPADPGFLNYLLSSEKLQHKGNFFCSLKGVNENTELNPLSIYTEIKNPLISRNA